jgi:hypothetical protein
MPAGLPNNTLSAGPPWLHDAGDGEGWTSRDWGHWLDLQQRLSSAGVRTLSCTEGDGLRVLHASGPETYPHLERVDNEGANPLLAALERLAAQFAG